MSHISMFKFSKSEQGHVQVITNSINKKELEDAGFVDHIDKVKAPTKRKPKARPEVEAEADA